MLHKVFVIIFVSILYQDVHKIGIPLLIPLLGRTRSEKILSFFPVEQVREVTKFLCFSLFIYIVPSRRVTLSSQ